MEQLPSLTQMLHIAQDICVKLICISLVCLSAKYVLNQWMDLNETRKFLRQHAEGCYLHNILYQ